MEDIARQTVEFLYEDVGKLPKELTFPTLDEAKGKAEELSAEKLSSGQVVLVSTKLPVASCGVRMMQKTMGVMGVVLEVEDKKQIARVECYIPSDAVLVSYWYPIVYLEKPPLGHTHSPILKATDAMQIHAHRYVCVWVDGWGLLHKHACTGCLSVCGVSQPAGVSSSTVSVCGGTCTIVALVLVMCLSR